MTGGKRVPMEGAHRCILFGLASGMTTFVPTKRLLNRIVTLFVATINPLSLRNFLYFQCGTEKTFINVFFSWIIFQSAIRPIILVSGPLR